MSPIRSVGHSRGLLLHINVASVISAIVAATATTTTAATCTVVVSTALLASSSIARLRIRLLDHLALNLVFRLDRAVVLLELGPAERLVLQHILNQLLDTLADLASAGCSRLR